jgi:hypothetical protein
VCPVYFLIASSFDAGAFPPGGHAMVLAAVNRRDSIRRSGVSRKRNWLVRDIGLLEEGHPTARS